MRGLAPPTTEPTTHHSLLNPNPNPNPNPSPNPNQVSDKVGLATELMYCHNQMCTFGLGYEFRLRQARP